LVDSFVNPQYSNGIVEIAKAVYDFDYLIEEEGVELKDVYIEFMRKAEKKGHDPKEFSLVKQMNEIDLPDFKNLWRKSSGHFKDLMKLLEN